MNQKILIPILYFVLGTLAASAGWFGYVQKTTEDTRFPETPKNRESLRINLYYHNTPKDIEIGKGTLACSSDSVLPVERKIPFTQIPLTESINLLLKGELMEGEKAQGFDTEFPLEGFKLVKAEINGDTAVLTFEDPLRKTSGGSCRAALLADQIAKTAKQFPNIKRVRFLPEDALFQP